MPSQVLLIESIQWDLVLPLLGLSAVYKIKKRSCYIFILNFGQHNFILPPKYDNYLLNVCMLLSTTEIYVRFPDGLRDRLGWSLEHGGYIRNGIVG